VGGVTRNDLTREGKRENDEGGEAFWRLISATK
jgi:hypothetical protein